MSRSQDKFVVRLPDGMRERISDEARSARRSMNMEIVHRLNHSIEAEEKIRRLEAALDDAQDANRSLREENRELAKRFATSLPYMMQAQGASA
ncbi:Arc family DNA-binding protein [Pseudomonas lopnurensis]|uniref:Arc family DNA-binding protein n=1 Tax=Pseudomonas lopnurensis TaxID=1477517 RepID=UPI0028AE1914|nr:Arc family DNA-binding protein [Pseudomonas lopnurensis]